MLFKSKHPELGIKLKCYYVQVSEFYSPKQNPKVRSVKTNLYLHMGSKFMWHYNFFINEKWISSYYRLIQVTYFFKLRLFSKQQHHQQPNSWWGKVVLFYI